MKKTQVEVAKLLGIGQSRLSQILSGKFPPRWVNAKKYAAIFPETSVVDWMEGNRERLEIATGLVDPDV